MTDYAIIETGGKQYRIEQGNNLRVESIKAEPGSSIELTKVLAVSNKGKVTLGTPTVEGAKVVAEVVAHGRGKKIIVFKYKSKTRYRKKNGHRQGYTDLTVKDIVTEKKRQRRTRTKKSEEEVDGS